VGKRVIVHEEAQFSEENQEKIKVLMEGGAFVLFPETVKVKFTCPELHISLPATPGPGAES